MESYPYLCGSRMPRSYLPPRVEGHDQNTGVHFRRRKATEGHRGANSNTLQPCNLCPPQAAMEWPQTIIGCHELASKLVAVSAVTRHTYLSRDVVSSQSQSMAGCAIRFCEAIAECCNPAAMISWALKLKQHSPSEPSAITSSSLNHQFLPAPPWSDFSKH